MLDGVKMGRFLAAKRKEAKMTQQQLAERLHVSFQAVSKWESGATYPSLETLHDLAVALHVSADDILAGGHKAGEALSYSKAGVDIAYTDSIKQAMAGYLQTPDRRVLNGLGPFAALYDIQFPSMEEPVLALKSEEPGSKQKLAMEYGFTESICYDMINHLVNDIVVMGARPLAVLDCIVCGNAEKDTIQTLVRGIADACRQNECSLVGGETSIQPAVVAPGTYVLTSSIVGIVERKKIVDGSAIRPGDAVLAVASNGLHTNGYSLVRLLMERMPQIKLDRVYGITFLEQIMKPHTAYYKGLKGLLGDPALHGMAHITGGGLAGNLSRVIPAGLSAQIDLSKIRPLPIFRAIKEYGSIEEDEMLRTFNCGVGFVLVVAPQEKRRIMEHMEAWYPCYEIGQIAEGEAAVQCFNRLDWVQ